jgi:hypothetical protein
MVHRGIATLAAGLTLCFLLLTHFDPQFFFLHFYESLIYIAIVLMLFYFEDRWAYMLGMAAPAGWLLLTFVTGGFGAFVRQTIRLLHAETPDYGAFVLGAVISILSVAMILFCAYRWKREFAGLGRGLSTLLISSAIVAVYYGILAYWFWRAVAASLWS